MDQKLGYLTIFSIFFVPRLFMMASSKQCEVKLTKSGRALKNHILKTVAVRTPLDCHFLCQNNMKCKSYNFMITGDICELNNSTKEARPHYFLPDDTRLYMRIRPAEASCRDIFNEGRGKGNGAYLLQMPTGSISVYCHMTSHGLAACGGGGWTLVMKIDGKKSTFHYDSEYWSNNKGLNLTEGETMFDNQETKLPTYWSTSFSKICLGVKTGRKTNFVVISKEASSLHALIADGKYRSTSLGREKWKSLINPSGSLQPHCNKEGFNARCNKGDDGQAFSKARIGVLGNNEDSCSSCDSRIGFGTAGIPDDLNTCGNEVLYEKHVKAICYILVQ